MQNVRNEFTGAATSVLLLVIVIVALSAIGVRPVAADNGEAKSIIAEHCVECHRVPGFAAGKGRPTIEAPDFQAIADDPKMYSSERLHAFLRKPHFPMRALILSEA
ncbi:MAG: hypothetical protein MPJ78_01725, partial [Hyphomicrobiaceae bacterium]|nr:hypothetical protein [Hyphomicrobiaceae bacterium]